MPIYPRTLKDETTVYSVKNRIAGQRGTQVSRAFCTSQDGECLALQAPDLLQQAAGLRDLSSTPGLHQHSEQVRTLMPGERSGGIPKDFKSVSGDSPVSSRRSIPSWAA